jgi:hypothetical protein
VCGGGGVWVGLSGARHTATAAARDGVRRRGFGLAAAHGTYGDGGALRTRRHAGLASARARGFRIAAARGTAMAAAWVGVGDGGGASLPLKAFSGNRPPSSLSGSKWRRAGEGASFYTLGPLVPVGNTIRD